MTKIKCSQELFVCFSRVGRSGGEGSGCINHSHNNSRSSSCRGGSSNIFSFIRVRNNDVFDSKDSGWLNLEDWDGQGMKPEGWKEGRSTFKILTGKPTRKKTFRED